jgi:hypothetical protein
VSKEGPTLPTHIGHAEWGDNHFRGYSVARDLAGREGVTSLLALAITGRRLDEDERLMLDDVATVTNVADPRVWPLKLVRVVSAYGGCDVAVAAATVALESALIGQHAAGSAAELLLHLGEGLVDGSGKPPPPDDSFLEERCRRFVAEHGRPVGFDVPFRTRDERVDMLTERVAARGRSALPYWQLFARVAEIFWQVENVRPNMPAAAGAVCLDLSLKPAQIGPLMTALGASAFWANAFEGAEQAPACLQRLPDNCVRYVGKPSRVSPRAAAPR